MSHNELEPMQNLEWPAILSEDDRKTLNEMRERLPYRCAIWEACGDVDPSWPITLSNLYWTARSAARYVAWQLLDEAKKAGCTDEQCEQLRKRACDVAPD